ncbi:MAG: hypothetical protein AABX83_00450 [Nanoarchaeota archaeon]
MDGFRVVKSTPHNHLRTSSHITAETANKAVKMAAKRLGRGGIFGVINFNPSTEEVDPRWDLFVKNLRYDKIHTGNGVYLEEPDILAVRGQEVPTKEGYHILLVGTCEDENIANGASLEDVLDQGDAFNAIIAADHPFHKHGVGNFLLSHPDYTKRFDLMETYNGIAIDTKKYKNANMEAWLFFKKIMADDINPDLTEFVSDDGHSIYELGRNYSNIKMPDDYKQFRDNPERLINALKEGYLANREENLGHKKYMSKIGAADHFVDLAILIAANKLLKWDPNRRTALLFDKFGIRI